MAGLFSSGKSFEIAANVKVADKYNLDKEYKNETIYIDVHLSKKIR
jgi:hypothetical protein